MTQPLQPAAKVRRNWPFMASVDADGRITQTLPVRKPSPPPARVPAKDLPDALF